MYLYQWHWVLLGLDWQYLNVTLPQRTYRTSWVNKFHINLCCCHIVWLIYSKPLLTKSIYIYIFRIFLIFLIILKSYMPCCINIQKMSKFPYARIDEVLPYIARCIVAWFPFTIVFLPANPCNDQKIQRLGERSRQEDKAR